MANLLTAARILLLVPLYGLLIWDVVGHRWIALALFLLAGLTDILDGLIARTLGQTSALGALLDLTADRLLTLTVVIGLIAAHVLRGPFAVAGLVLVARDLIVASMGEAAQGRLQIRVTPPERMKIALQFTGFALLIAPPQTFGSLRSEDLGAAALALSAALACVILVGYARLAGRALRPEPPSGA